MRTIQVLITLAAMYLLFGCASNTARGNAIDVRLIEPSQEITVLWDLGHFDAWIFQDALAMNRTELKRFERCTNHFIEQAFLQRGYLATARMVNGAETLRIPEIKTPYVVLLHNTHARGIQQQKFGITTLLSGTVLLSYEGRLHETKHGAALWTVTAWLSSNAENNDKYARDLVDALAADGFLGAPQQSTNPRQSTAIPDNPPPLGCRKKA